MSVKLVFNNLVKYANNLKLLTILISSLIKVSYVNSHRFQTLKKNNIFCQMILVYNIS